VTATLPPFLAGIRVAMRELVAGDVLFAEGDAPDALYRVDAGTVRLDRGGAVQQRAGRGEWFGEAGLFSPGQSCAAVAESAVRVSLWPKAAIVLHLRAHPDLALGFAAWIAGRMDQARGLAQVLRLKSAEDKVVSYLTLAGAAHGTVTLDRPLIQVAAEMGLTHESLYRTLTKLAGAGRIVRLGKRTFSVT
jgi:CRP-like cAMP-binding protein